MPGQGRAGGVTDTTPGTSELGTSEALLAGLDPEQREVALAARGPVCVLAGAGTGKTRAITYRIAYAASAGLVDPAHVLALTFTVRAAGELRGRLRPPELGSAGGLGTGLVRASTFHAAALRQLNYFWPRVIGGRPPRLIDSKASLVREAARQPRPARRCGREGWQAERLADAAAEIEWAKVTPGPPGRVRGRHGRRGPLARGRRGPPGRGLRRLRGAAAERHLIDFESVLELTAAILIDSQAAADQVRDTFRHFVVDEYQDVNPLQKLLLDAWLGDRDDLCVVGDPHQVIYSFTGATPSYLTGFTAEFPGAAVVRLVRDYRSTPQVVAVANQLVRSRPAGLPGQHTPLAAQRPPGPRPVLTEYPDDTAEAAGLAIQVQALLAAGVQAREIAVLVRVNADTERFELALAEARVPYVVRGAERFYERPAVRQALVLLRGAARGERAARGEAGCQGRAGRRGRAGPAPAGTPSPGPGGADPLPSSVRHVLTGIGLTPNTPSTPSTPGTRGPRRARAGSRSPRSPSSPTTCTPRGRRRR